MSGTGVVPIPILVGIDIGYTCTGVAICSDFNSGNGIPSVIQNWPGSNTIVNKVPTKLVYAAAEIDIRYWGMECPDLQSLEGATAIIDVFKFFLDRSHVEKFRRVPPAAFKLENVKMWYADFLTALHGHIMRHLREQLRVDFDSTSVEFIFSIPTSWKGDDLLVGRFRELVEKSGFGNNGNVVMEMTEAEAAAVFTAKIHQHNFQEGDVFMVLDAGGGTTDMCVLKVKRVQEDMVELQNLAKPKDLPVGSVRIDEIFEDRVKDQLQALLGVSPELAQNLARQVRSGPFQAMKHRFGTQIVDSLSVLKMEVPNSSHSINLPKNELKEMFDSQIQQLTRSIDAAIALLKTPHPNVTLSDLFLAGGLGSSKYVQAEIMKHCEALRVRVLFAPDPKDLPLAVCKGLVIDRFQQFFNNLPVVPIQSNSSSYGILCKEKYDSNKHPGQSSTKNQLNGKKYAEDQIDWIVRKDENHEKDTPVSRFYSLLFDPSRTAGRLSFSIVTSTEDPDRLPTFLDGTGSARILCHVTSGEALLYHGDVVQKRGLTGKKPYYRVDFELLATIGVGKMKFTLRFLGENDRPQALKVQWEESLRFQGRGFSGLIKSI
ncbi:uncharacterized protein PAC_20153 [Phialocephala subalpina]|uniref:Hsp70 protein n=1 Tax=Phialocephala subalpina TaxID=576137 RepID=A0A1L7XYW6_9HELO|nr:uncharacterized protein PAC_20153 [Phialocephala subalpina]